MQHDSFSREQVTAHQGAQFLDLLGAFIRPQETRPNSPVGELNSGFVQDFVGLWSSDIQPTERASEQAAREAHIPEMISSSQSIRTVATAIFDDVRPLTDKERNYLRKFYSRVYKKR
jgi:hypothetical protein